MRTNWSKAANERKARDSNDEDSASSGGQRPLLSPDDLAAYLAVPVATAYRWRSRREGPRGIRVGRHVRYRTEDVDRWLDARREHRPWAQGEVAYVEKRHRKRADGSRAEVVWRARYRGPDGRERSQTFATKEAAQRWLATVETSMVRNDWIDPKAGKTPCGDYIDGWLATKADVAASTKLNIEGRIKKHIRPFFEDMPLNAVRPTHARTFVAGLVASGLAPATVKSITLTASQVFAQAVEDNLIAPSPCANVALTAERQHEEIHFLTPEQVNALAGTIDDRYRAAIYLAAYGGLRAGELWALRVERLNTLAATVDIVTSMSEAGGLHAGPTKTGKRRTIRVPRFLAQMLGEHIGQYASPDGWVFTASEGGPVHHTTSATVTTRPPSPPPDSPTTSASTTYVTHARRS